MKNALMILAISVLTITANSASAECKIAVGGPGANMSTLDRLSSSLQTMFDSHKGLQINVYSVSSLPEAVSTEADFMVYLKGDAGNAEVQFRNLLSNIVMSDKSYSASNGLDATIKSITKNIEQTIIPKLPDYCR